MKSKWTTAWFSCVLVLAAVAGTFTGAASAINNPNCTTNNSSFNTVTQQYNLKGTMAGCVRGVLTVAVSAWDDEGWVNDDSYPSVTCSGATSCSTPSHSGTYCMPAGDKLHILVTGNSSNDEGVDYRQQNYTVITSCA